jgi:outer membrane protein assembly factor BamE (lipoprotein component of BamABCDE complex)
MMYAGASCHFFDKGYDMTFGKKNNMMVIAAILCVLLAGCASLEAQKRLKEYEGYFEPLVGKAQATDITRKFGAPIRKDRIGTSEFWYYHLPYRDPKGAQGSKGLEGGYAVGSESEVYDDLTIEYDSKGYLKSWRGYIQR